jgi:hypothetical protein
MIRRETFLVVSAMALGMVVCLLALWPRPAGR